MRGISLSVSRSRFRPDLSRANWETKEYSLVVYMRLNAVEVVYPFSWEVCQTSR